ncbi:MAG: transposase [Firmicutes bacterium]|nr:transposase [Bacillota bacterium]
MGIIPYVAHRRASRRKNGSKNQKKVYQKAARSQRYEKHVRHEYAHQTSHALVVNAAYDLYVFEDLPIQQMTKRPKAKQDPQGHFLPNGRAAKAGLNRAILASAWGQLVTFTRYKALWRGKWVITVPPAQSSQECAELHVHLSGQPAPPSRICLSTLRTYGSRGPQCRGGDQKTRDSEIVVRRTADAAPQTPADFSRP